MVSVGPQQREVKAAHREAAIPHPFQEVVGYHDFEGFFSSKRAIF
jgi:hypothetical protein